MNNKTTKPTHWVMDYETLSNCFIAVFQHYSTKHTKIFICSRLHNDVIAYINFLEQCIQYNQWHISFNGIAFDAQISHYVLHNKVKFIGMTGEQFAREMSAYAQKTIEKANRKEFSDYPLWKMQIQQIDLFKLNHWDNPAKSSSLKWIQYSMDWNNVKEMPIHHTTEITTQAQIDEIVSYCINDVESTKQILFLCKDQVNLRKDLTNEYGINLYSASEPRISKELFAHFLCEKLGWDKKELKELRTPRSEIILKDCILPYVKFNTEYFKQVHEYFKSKVITETKGALNYSIKYKGVKTDYGLGGIHGAREAGIYEAKPGWTIMTSDVVSFYPNLAIKNGFAPAHLPKQDFLELYEWFFNERKLIPKSDPRNYVYKIILNSTYGLSNDANSFLYDPMFTMQITINGQLLLSMLYEMLAEGIPEAVPLMQNTDGLEMMIPENKKDLYYTICSDWEILTNLALEHDEYKRLILRDVNNYIAVYKNGKTKCKGFFEFSGLALHKNKSFLIIPKAIYNYFVNDIKPEDYLDQNQDFMDYCGAVKAKGEWTFQTQEMKDGEVCITNLQKLNRYYVSTTGTKMVKVHPDGREIQTEAGRWRQTICNDMSQIENIPFDELNIDKAYYLESIYKEINNINNKVSRGLIQGELF
jgi:hypothetical protein